jgi:hypothetical protein
MQVAWRERPRIATLLAVFAVAVLTIPWSITPITGGLDQSWRWGLNAFSSSSVRFGRDLIFSYGPLGYLGGRLTSVATWNRTHRSSRWADVLLFFFLDRAGRTGDALRSRRFARCAWMRSGAWRSISMRTLSCERSGETCYKLHDDPRLIPIIGRFFRRFSIDELPQL